MKPPAYLSRPLGILAVFAALALGGLFCLSRLPVELLPRLPYPRLTVVTVFEHAPPQEVETLVTRRLEGVLGTVAGVRRLESVSAEGLSQMTLIFQWGRDLGHSAAEVREKLDSVADQLPREAQPPLVLHYDPSEAPVITLGLTGPAAGTALRAQAQDVLKNRLETLEGVAAVRLNGGLVPEVQVEADLARLVAQNLDLGTLVERIKKANLNSPAGELRLGNLELPVRTLGRFASPQDIPQVPVGKGQGGALVSLAEVARVRAGHKDQTGFCRVDGLPAVLLSVQKEPGANAVEVSRRVRERLAPMAAGLPTGWGLQVVDDQAPFVEDSLAQLRDAVLWGGLLAFLVLAWFLRRMRAALLVMLSVPVSLLATLGAMYLAGVGLNLMSIGGLALGVGTLVDASIVVLEAFERHQARAGEPLAAAASALGEVRGGLITATLTTVSVLVPVLFLTGLAQRLFQDFAFTLVASLLFSLATALLLLPALLVWLGRGQVAAARPPAQAAHYRRALQWSLAHPLTAAGLGLLALVLGLGGLWVRGAALLPEVGGGRLLVQLRLPPESGLPLLTGAVDRAEEFLRARPEVASLVTRAGVDPHDSGGQGGDLGLDPGRPHEAMLTVHLKPGQGLGRGAEGLRTSLRQGLTALGGFEAEVLPAGNLTEPGREALSPPQLLRLMGDDLDTLVELSAKVLARLKDVGGLAGLVADGAAKSGQLQVRVDREAAAAQGVNVTQVAQELRRAVQGEVAGKLLQGDRETDIRVRLQPGDRQEPAALGELPLLGQGGQTLRLRQVANLHPGQGPQEILRQERRRTVLIRGQVTGQAFSQGQESALAAAGQVELPAGYELRPGSQGLALSESLSSLGAALGLSLMLIYVILVVQFESLRWPLVILLALPPLALGPALALNLTGLPLSALVLLGSVVLIGMAVNTSILLVDYTNQLRRAGMAPAQALLQAAQVRRRPIVMTTLTTVLGALPLALGLGAGADLAQPLALTVVTGLFVSIAATLLLVPALYRLFLGRGAAR
ncbi:MAG: efflux RND transporter permease subunit [Desulfarculus sp.]|nr:efflux RND transporter permease subunit [Desulfarculus sp.]